MIVQICVFTKAALDGPGSDSLSKRIQLDTDGRLFADSSPCRMAAGTAVNAPASDATALAWLIDNMAPSQALALGTIGHADGQTMNVVTAAALARLSPALRDNNTIARTREYISFRPQAPAWLLVDYDLKGMPAPVQSRLASAGGPWEALLTVVPGVARAARVTRASTSAGLSNQATGEQSRFRRLPRLCSRTRRGGRRPRAASPPRSLLAPRVGLVLHRVCRAVPRALHR
jgi:hypothetical protein